MNTTASLPGYYYLLDRQVDEISRGDIVVFALKQDAFYGDAKLMKVIAGMPGDHISWRGRDVYVNDVFHGRALKRAQTGEALVKNHFSGVIPQGRYWVWTPYLRSYDSRYDGVGLVKASDILGRAKKVY